MASEILCGERQVIARRLQRGMRVLRHVEGMPVSPYTVARVDLSVMPGFAYVVDLDGLSRLIQNADPIIVEAA